MGAGVGAAPRGEEGGGRDGDDPCGAAGTRGAGRALEGPEGTILFIIRGPTITRAAVAVPASASASTAMNFSMEGAFVGTAGKRWTVTSGSVLRPPLLRRVVVIGSQAGTACWQSLLLLPPISVE